MLTRNLYVCVVFKFSVFTSFILFDSLSALCVWKSDCIPITADQETGLEKESDLPNSRQMEAETDVPTQRPCQHSGTSE